MYKIENTFQNNGANVWMYNFDTSEEEEPEWGVPELNGCSHAMELGYLFGWVGGELK